MNSLKYNFQLFALAFLISFTSPVFIAGCTTTVTPVQVHSDKPSFDANGQRTSGFYGFYTNVLVLNGVTNSTVFGIVSQETREKYNSLISKYGSKLTPPIRQDFGIIDNKTNCFISFPAITDFATMNRWLKSGK